MACAYPSPTARRALVPPRSEKPGLKYRKAKSGKVPYWVASQVVRDSQGYPDKTVALPIDADESKLKELCQYYTTRLFEWINNEESGKRVTFTQYDGSVRSLSRYFQEHPDSPFHEAKKNTREYYVDSLKILEAEVGQRVIRRLTVTDVRRWYRKWKEPKVEGGKPRIDRAHDAVTCFRMILRFGYACGYDECGELDDRLKKVRFEKGGARDKELTYQQVVDFIKTAFRLAEEGVIPEWRGKMMAIAEAAKFELMLRQKDIIGEWRAHEKETPNAIYCGTEMWVGFFTWEKVPGWRWRMKTSKSKYRAAAEFDLTRYSLLYPMLESIPHEDRSGAIVKGEHGLPVREHSYRKWFRKIARAAGIPDDVWSMDSRAGAATEAEEAGADLEAIQAGLTHSNKSTTLRYIRRRSRRIAEVADARERHRQDAEGA